MAGGPSKRLAADQIIVSPCSNPEMELEPVLEAYSAIGYRQFEVFTSWARSAFDIRRDPEFYLGLGRKYGMTFRSMHLPPVTDDFDRSLATAIDAAKFAKAVGVKTVLYKANSRSNYARGSRAILDALVELSLVGVLQNHFGTPISTLDDFREVIQAIADARMKTLLEVGHFHSAGVSWKAGYGLLGDSIALVHIKDQIGRESVPFGRGEIDLRGLFAHMAAIGYTGGYVVEMEVGDREHTLEYLADALKYVTGR